MAPRSKLCQQGRHDFDADGVCKRKGCSATMTLTMFPMTVAEEEQAYGFSVDRASQGFRPGDAQQGLFDAKPDLHTGTLETMPFHQWKASVVDAAGVSMDEAERYAGGKRIHLWATSGEPVWMAAQALAQMVKNGKREDLASSELQAMRSMLSRSRKPGATNPCGRKHTMKKRKNSGPRPRCTGCNRFLPDSGKCRACAGGKRSRARACNPIVLAPGAISWQGMAGMAAALGNPPKKGKRHPPIHYCVSFMAPGGEPVSACGTTEGFVIQDKRRVTCAPCKRQKPMKRVSKRNPAVRWEVQTPPARRGRPWTVKYRTLAEGDARHGLRMLTEQGVRAKLVRWEDGLAHTVEDNDSDGYDARQNPWDHSQCMAAPCKQKVVQNESFCPKHLAEFEAWERQNPGVRWTCRMFSSGGHGHDCEQQAMGSEDAPPRGWEYFPTYHRDPREKLWKDAECPACQRYGEQVRAKYGLPPKRIRGRIY